MDRRYPDSIRKLRCCSEILQKALTMVEAFLRTNIIKADSLRRLAGVNSFIAGFVEYIRPFNGVLWAALAETQRRDRALAAARHAQSQRKSRPLNSTWRSQILVALLWFRAFYTQNMRLERAYPIKVNRQHEWQIWTDASPWRLGAILV